MPLARSENGLSGEIRLDDVDYRRIVYDVFATGLGATSFEPTCGETKYQPHAILDDAGGVFEVDSRRASRDIIARGFAM